MSYPERPISNARLAILLALFSLPLVASVLTLRDRTPAGVPSPLSLALMFIYFVYLPTVAWLMAYRNTQDYQSPAQLQLARFGESRLPMAVKTLTKQGALLFILAYLMSSICYFINYGALQVSDLNLTSLQSNTVEAHPLEQLSRTLRSELVLIVPVALAWSALVVCAFRAIFSWMRKFGLFLSVLCYALLLQATVPLTSALGLEATPPSPTLAVLLSPTFHMAGLLGALVEQITVPGWISLGVLCLYSCLSLFGLLVRVPR